MDIAWALGTPPDSPPHPDIKTVAPATNTAMVILDDDIVFSLSMNVRAIPPPRKTTLLRPANIGPDAPARQLAPLVNFKAG